MIVIKSILFMISLISSLAFVGLSGDELSTLARHPSAQWSSLVPYLSGLVVSVFILVQVLYI